MSSNTVTDLKEERRDVIIFVCDAVRADENSRFLISEAYELYREWRKKRGFTPTVLTIDGFGRLFPRTFTRRTIYKEGSVSRGVVGARLGAIS